MEKSPKDDLRSGKKKRNFQVENIQLRQKPQRSQMIKEQDCLGIWDSGVPEVSEENDFPGSRKSKDDGNLISGQIKGKEIEKVNRDYFFYSKNPKQFKDFRFHKTLHERRLINYLVYISWQ